MRIIKHINDISIDEVATIIAGEMLNIEMSMLYFLDGKSLPPTDRKKGYPQITNGTVVNVIKAAAGYIYFPSSLDIDVLETKIIAAINALSREIEPEIIQPLTGYHTQSAGIATNIKVKSSMQLTTDSLNPTTKNIKRQFRRNEHSTYLGRFVWTLNSINNIDYDITSDNFEQAIERLGCGILYDQHNITTCAHNDKVYDFSPKYFRATPYIIEKDIKLYRYGPPLLYELSTFWYNKTRYELDNTGIRNLTSVRIIETDYAQINVSSDVCASCGSVLYDDNYVLCDDDLFSSQHASTKENMHCIAICPLCMHSAWKFAEPEAKYSKIRRVKFPRSIEAMIASLSGRSSRHEDILSEIAKHGIKSVAGMKLIGPHYAIVSNIDDYKYTNLVHNPELKDRFVFASSTFSHNPK